MKKFAITLIACLAFVQSAYAATSALAESLLEQQAITSALGTNPNFQDIIPAVEFIVDIKRITPIVKILGHVKYKIVTREVGVEAELVAPAEQKTLDSSSSGSHHHRHHHKGTTYIATLDVTPNGIGPTVITVLSIKKIHRQTKSFVKY